MGSLGCLRKFGEWTVSFIETNDLAIFHMSGKYWCALCLEMKKRFVFHSECCGCFETPCIIQVLTDCIMPLITINRRLFGTTLSASIFNLIPNC